MKSLKKAVATMLVMALCLSGVSYQKQTAKAADSTDPLTLVDTTLENVTAGVAYTTQFTLPSAGTYAFGIYTLEKTEFTYTVLNSNGVTVFGPKAVTVGDSDWGVTTNGVPYFAFGAEAPAGGTFTLSLTFTADQTVVGVTGLYMAPTSTASPTPTPVAPSLDFNSITVTKGFKEKISVVNANGAKLTFSSSNTKVATVDANGVVTGKKKGNAVITVKTSTGYTLTCKVTVKDNVFSVKQISGSQVRAGSFVVDVYNISYDKKGNLVIKTKMINKRGYKAKYLKNFKITVKNSNGKKIGVYSAKKMTINLKTGKAKKYTFKIKKSKVKAKQNLAELTYSDVKVSGKYYYNY